MLLVHFWVDVSVHQQQVGPAIVIEVEEQGVPSEILGVESQSGGERNVVKCSISVVTIERGSVVGKIGAKNVQLAVTIEISDGAAHASLRAPIFVEGRTCDHCHVGEG